MSFSALSSYTQDIIMVQFEFFAKIFILVLFTIFAILMITYYKKKRAEQIKKQEDSPYLLFDLTIKMLNYLSYIYLYLMPLYIIWLYPQATMDGMLRNVFNFYRISFILIGIILFSNLFLYGGLLVARLSGVKINHKKAEKVLDTFLGEKKNLFKR